MQTINKAMNSHENKANFAIFGAGKTFNEILVQVWLPKDGNGRDKLVAQKKAKMGDQYVSIRPKSKGLLGSINKSEPRLFQINYKELKEGKNRYIYDTELENTSGALAFHKFPKSKDNLADSALNQKMLIDFAAKMYILKKDYLLYLMIAVLGLVMVAMALAYVAVDYGNYRNIAEQLDKMVTSLKAENAVLKAQVIPNG